MKITILGRWGAYPEAGESTAGYLLEHNGFHILLDCGSGVLAQLQKHLPLHQLDAVILTHFHHDHVADVGCLLYAAMIETKLGKRQKVLPIYAPKNPVEQWEALRGTEGTTIHAIDEGEPLSLGGLNFQFLKTIHPIYCLAVRVQSENHSFVYTADTSYFDPLVHFASGADLLLADCNFYAHQHAGDTGHMNSREVASLAKEAGVKEVILTHLPHFGDPKRLVTEAKELFPGPVHLAELGLQFQIPGQN